MPSLKDLNCSIELSDSEQSLQEFGTIYGDGFVETFVPVPSKPKSFSVHLTSNNFIAPGIALYVFIDGVYQCNRNRQDLKLRKPSDSRSLVDFRVRQKEEKQRDGSMIAREWTFEKLNSVSADDAPDRCSPNILENIGCIEVVVLRCAGSRNAKTASNMNFDGASDAPDHPFGLDGKARDTEGRSLYDDRGPFVNGFSFGGPPPSLPSYQRPYAETVHSHKGTRSHGRSNTHNTKYPSPDPSIAHHPRPYSRYSEPISPGAPRMSSIPSSAFQYGSGPLPPEGVPFHARPSSAIITNAPGVDPAWLDKVLKKAVKQGVEESRRNEQAPKTESRHQRRTSDLKAASQAPGAWPLSPYSTTSKVLPFFDPAEAAMRSYNNDQGTTWGQSQGGWSQQQPLRERQGSHVKWNTETVWESESNSGNWNSSDETPLDSWDTEETWGSKETQASQPSRQRGCSKAPTATSKSKSRRASRVIAPTNDRWEPREGQSWRSRSKSRPRQPKCKDKDSSSSEDRDRWTHIDAKSDSIASWEESDDTLQPSRSRSQVKTPRSRSRRRSRRSKSAHSDRERRSSRRSSRPIQEAPRTVHPASPMTQMTPTVMNTRTFVPPAEGRSRRTTVYTEPGGSVTLAPIWGGAVPEKSRKGSGATSYFPPAPYGTPVDSIAHSAVGNDQGGSRSNSSSSWGIAKDYAGVKNAWGDEANKEKDWLAQDDDEWRKTSPVEETSNGWEAPDDKQNGGWEAVNATNNEQTADWEKKDTSWQVQDTSRKEWDAPGNLDAWTTNKDSWNIRETTKQDWNTAKPIDMPWDNLANATNAWDTHNPTDKPTTTPLNPDTLWPTIPTPETPSKHSPTSKRHSTKSLSKYRQLRSSSVDLTPKPHWKFPPSPPPKPLYLISEHQRASKSTFIAPKEPLYEISRKTASEKGVEHQVRAGKGVEYGHVVGRPEYLDRLEKPYAVFRFKYRSRAILRSLFGDVVPAQGALTKHTPSSALAKKKEQLKDVSHGELVEKMLKLQTKLERRGSGRENEQKRREKHGKSERKDGEGKRERRRSDATESVARGLTESWVEEQSRGASEKSEGKGEDKKTSGKSQGKAKEKKKEEVKGKEAWDKTAGNGEAAWGDMK